MLKIRKSKIKVVGIITFLSLLSISYAGLSFYSIPEKVNAAEEFTEWRDLTNITYMQEMTVDICNNSKVGDRKALIDNRGGGYTNQGRQNSYIVQKLSDGNCWMGQNLNLTDKALTAEDSNAPASGYAIPAHSANGWSNSDYNSNKVYYGSIANPDADINKYGAYYTWYAATAGTSPGTYRNEASGSICPKGWKLPASNVSITTDGSFNKLTTIKSLWHASGVNGYTNSMLSVSDTSGYLFSGGFFPAAGRFYNGSLSSEVGSIGCYWSSMAGDGTSAFNLYFDYSTVAPSANPVPRYYGLSVRCVANSEIKSSDLADATFGNIDANVNVQVGPTLTIDAATGMSGQVDYTKVLEGSISATVSSNLNYDVMLSATQPALTKSDDATKTIPPVTAIASLQKGVSGWGIWTGEGNTVETRTYEPINNSPQAYYSTTTPAEDGIGTIHTFGVGIAVSPTVPHGTYSTVVTVTAANA